MPEPVGEEAHRPLTVEQAGRMLKASTKRRWPRWLWPSLAASKMAQSASKGPS